MPSLLHCSMRHAQPLPATDVSITTLWCVFKLGKWLSPGADVPRGPADAVVRYLVRVPSQRPPQCGRAVPARCGGRPLTHQGALAACLPAFCMRQRVRAEAPEGLVHRLVAMKREVPIGDLLNAIALWLRTPSAV